VATDNAAVERVVLLLADLQAALRAGRTAGQQAEHAHREIESARFSLDHPDGGDRGYVGQVNGLLLPIWREENFQLAEQLVGRV
jgi:hypothetical protein